MTIGVLGTALEGIQKNQRRFESAADDLSRAGETPPPDLVDAAARLLTARRGLEACLQVARTGDEILGTVIDVLA